MAAKNGVGWRPLHLYACTAKHNVGTDWLSFLAAMAWAFSANQCPRCA